MIKFTKKNPVTVLNVGTRILLKDVMDQYLRTFGEVKTFYASKLSSAVESFRQHNPQIVFCEHLFPEGSAIELVEAIGGLSPCQDRYFVLATEQPSDELISLAMEENIDEILAKPFSTDDVAKIVERYAEKRELLRREWCQDLLKARTAEEQKRFQEALALYSAAIGKYPAEVPVLLDAGAFFLSQGKKEEAARCFEKVLSLNPQNPRALFLEGQLLKRSGKFKDAMDRFHSANQVSPLNTRRYKEMVDGLLMMADERAAFALKTDSENSWLILSRLKIMTIRRDYKAAVQYMETRRALLGELDRKEADVYLSLAKKMAGIR